MLFAVKRHLGLTLALLAAFVGTALILRAALGLTWRLEFRPEDLQIGRAHV